MIKIKAMTADGLEEVECLSVVDVLRRQGYDVKMVAIKDSLEVTGSNGIRFFADELFDANKIRSADMIFLPGGLPGTTNLGAHKGLVELLKEFAADPAKRIAAICAAPSVLGENDLLKGKRAVCYPGFEKKLIGAISTDAHVVTDGRITTAEGMGVAISLALEIIRLFDGEAEASARAENIRYFGKI